ncbi:hypothetical protein QFC21_004477 [Naganishia friedmannii]|uniref:Uncharacterized protein n=1 Tax=Naganishia friedmannii TaxID=89922 RepID=A0ACC2VGI2_9TREE|nr:hypothetical protein QFC21_004477 [Naganishia friedmannii]
MSTSRSKLKQIQTLLKEEQYEDVVSLAKELLKEEKGKVSPPVYNALVFAGVALTKLGKVQEAEKVYLQATRLFPALPLAFQGINKLYTETEQWEKLGGLMQGLAHDNQVSTIADLLLPSSPIYSLLYQLPRLGDTSSSAPSADARNPSGQDNNHDDHNNPSYTPWTPPSLPPPPTIHSLPLSSAPPPSSYQYTTPPAFPALFPPINQIIHHPDTGLALLLTLTIREELEERQREEKEVQARRKRLGAGSEKELPEYYEEISRHPAASDETRRAAEGKTLRHYYRLMHCLSRNAPPPAEPALNSGKAAHRESSSTTTTTFPENLFEQQQFDAAADDDDDARVPLPSKESTRAKVEEIVKGMVLLKVEDEGAWTVLLEWTDVGSLEEYDQRFLHEFILTFPLSPVATLLSGFLRYFGFPAPDADEEEKARRGKRREMTRRREAAAKKMGEGEGGAAVMPVVDDSAGATDEGRQAGQEKDPFAVLLAGYEGCPKLIFAHRVMAEAHLREVDYASAISVAEKGIGLARAMEMETGKKMPCTRAALDVTLGTALVHYFAPKHHPRALQLLDGVLKQNPKATACFMGKGYIFLADDKFSDARTQFAEALEVEQAKRKDTEEPSSGLELEAKENVGWCLIKEGLLEDGKAQLMDVVEVLDADESRGQDAARVWTRIGQAEWGMGGEHREEAHEHWLTALKRFSSYAPAFTAIGIWYLEYSSPPDEERASKCFQKAFELDATEADAARRLAIGYANEGEWALVNLIAKRVMEGEGGLEGGLSTSNDKTANSKKFLPTNAWAWKALGAFEMVNKKYSQAAQAFQVALRADVDDPALWARLGEAYAKSGKQVAALKALRRALDIAPENWICYYHIATVQQELSLYQQAIESLQKALELSLDQTGTIVALAGAQLALGTQQRREGLRARAAVTLGDAMRTLEPVLSAKVYRTTTWKTFGELCINLAYTCKSEQDVIAAMEAVRPVIQHLQTIDENDAASVKGVVSLNELVKDNSMNARNLLKAGICAYAYRADLLKYDTKIPELALYDLACALHLLASDPSFVSNTDREAATRAATMNVKKALDIDPTSPTLWNAFGSVAAMESPQLAQHAYIIALELEPKNEAVWCNLGFLWLSQADHELAGLAFSKAKIIQPESMLAWLGEGMIAQAEHRDEDAQASFAQAVMLSGSSLLLACLGNSKLLFEPLVANVSSDITPDLHALHQASFALERYCSTYLHDSSALLLHGLMLERLGQYDLAVARVSAAAALLEAEYEAAESEEVEQRYAIALLDLGRIHLAQEDPSSAVETLENCFGLISARQDNAAKLMRVQAQVGMALGNAALTQIEESLQAFQNALSEADSLMLRDTEKDALKERVSVSLAKTLWSIGGDEAFEMAKTRLLESFSAEQHSASAMVSLSSIALMTDDDALTEAVMTEADELDEGALMLKDPRDLLRRFRALWRLSQGDVTAAKRLLSKSVHSAPSSSKCRASLAGLMVSYGQTDLARAVLATNTISTTQDTSVDGGEYSRIRGLAAAGFTGTEHQAKGRARPPSISDIQRAIKLRPWDTAAWQSLAQVSL